MSQLILNQLLWRTSCRLKKPARSALLSAYRVAGRYLPYQEDELRTVRLESLPYVGDVPASSKGDDRNHVRHRYEFEVPRDPRLSVGDLLYTENGMAWVDGRLQERYSVHAPRIIDLVRRPSLRHVRVLNRGTIVHSYAPLTYGDWFLEHLSTLQLAGRLDLPLLLPRRILERGYVQRDLAMLGLEATPVDNPVLIREAVVLRRTIWGCHWTTREAGACRRAYRADPVTPRPGSMIYLSREGEVAASVARKQPHQIINAVMEDLGVRVVRAKSTTLEDYRALAADAETVIADHGAAMCNLVLWGTKNVVELYSNSWWNPYFLFLGNSLGISNYALVSTDEPIGSDHQALKEKIGAIIDSFS